MKLQVFTADGCRRVCNCDGGRFLSQSTLSLALILLLLMSGSNVLCAADVLVHSATKDNNISRSKARLYFSQRLTRWPDGTLVTLVVLPDNNPLHINFSKKILGLYPYQLRRAWDRQLFTGTGQAPVTVENEQEARKIIAMTLGSLSYVSGDESNHNIRLMEIR